MLRMVPLPRCPRLKAGVTGEERGGPIALLTRAAGEGDRPQDGGRGAGRTARPSSVTEFSPREIVSELDRFVVGHAEAKRAVAIALRNRWRRRRTPEGMQEEITPKNILMIGPTGVGKTEIARRLARLAQAPFLKVE